MPETATLGLVTADMLESAIAEAFRHAETRRFELERMSENLGISYYQLVARAVVIAISSAQ